MINLLRETLKDSSVPANRVIRKAFALSWLAVFALLYQRHFILGFTSLGSLLMSLFYSAFLILVVCVFGGGIMAEVYSNFLAHVEAKEKKPSATTFVVEWLLALAAPIAGSLFWYVLSIYMDGQR